uniref:Uncharacterized protein n=1 Tax=Arundo donax TaxID=35708 RepID=A0A0A9E4L8_ARUDO
MFAGWAWDPAGTFLIFVTSLSAVLCNDF